METIIRGVSRSASRGTVAAQRTPDGSSFLLDRDSDVDATLPMRNYPQFC